MQEPCGVPENGLPPTAALVTLPSLRTISVKTARPTCSPAHSRMREPSAPSTRRTSAWLGASGASPDGAGAGVVRALVVERELLDDVVLGDDPSA